MDTERFLNYSEEKWSDVNSWIEATEEELHDLTSFVELSRHVQEINQWFEIFLFSLNELKRVYIATPERIQINTFLISLLGSGKCMVDSIEVCIKNAFSNDEFVEFKGNTTRKEFDNCFSYRFLYKLRNFSQHGHIPVSVINEKIHFDMNQIYHTPHYEFNKQLKREIASFMDYVKEKQDVTEGPFLDFQYTVCDYTCAIFRIYKKYLLKIKTTIESSWIDLKNELEKSPELYIHEEEKLRGMIFYHITDGNDNTIHAFNIFEDPCNMVRKFYNKTIDVLKAETDILKSMRKDSVKI